MENYMVYVTLPYLATILVNVSITCLSLDMLLQLICIQLDRTLCVHPVFVLVQTHRKVVSSVFISNIY